MLLHKAIENNLICIFVDHGLLRLGEADDFKGVAVFLASDESSFMTGQALTICGGASMWS